ncbi:hypothetical protein M2366_003794 [Aeromonas sp. BIGb0405]|nr:hypothetical protein [Aeromonas sp. BIGb0405]
MKLNKTPSLVISSVLIKYFTNKRVNITLTFHFAMRQNI